MKLDDVRAEQLGLLARLRVRRGRCPRCGCPLIEEKDRESITLWTHIPERHVIRAGNRRMMHSPRIRCADVTRCLRCTACGRWYVGRWAYHEVNERMSQRATSHEGR